MARFSIYVAGTLQNAVCMYTLEAESKEEALKKYQSGDVLDTEITEGDFQADDGWPDIDDVELLEGKGE